VSGHRITINICQLGQFPFDGGRLRVGLACLLRLTTGESAGALIVSVALIILGAPMSGISLIAQNGQ